MNGAKNVKPRVIWTLKYIYLHSRGMVPYEIISTKSDISNAAREAVRYTTNSGKVKKCFHIFREDKRFDVGMPQRWKRLALSNRYGIIWEVR